MKKSILFVVFCTICLALHAQIPPSKRVLVNEKKESDNFNFLNTKGYLYYFFDFVDENGFMYYTERKEDGLYICKANSKFENLLSVKTNPVKIQREELKPYQLLMGKNKIFLVTFATIASKSSHLYIQEFDKESLKPLQEPQKLTELDHKKTPIYYYPFTICLSPDRSKALFYSNTIPDKEPGKVDCNFIFDLNTSKIMVMSNPKFVNAENFGKKDEITYVIKDAVIDNTGTAYILTKVVESEYENTLKYRLGRFSSESRHEEVAINLEGKKISSLKLSLKSSGNIEINGFFSKESFWRAEGMFSINYDKGTINQKEVKEYLFEEELLFKHLSESEVKDLKKVKSKGKSIGVDFLGIKNIFEQSDGIKVVVAEQYNSTSRNNSNGESALPGNMTSLANHIFVFYFSTEGQLMKTVKIKKRQSCDGLKFIKMSFYATLVNDNLYFLYNDFIDNVTNEESSNYKEYNPYKKGTAMVLMILENGGKISKEIILDEKSSNFEFAPNYAMRMSDNSLFIYYPNGKYTYYSILKL